MAAQKSIAKGAGTHSAAPESRSAVRPRRAEKSRSSRRSPARDHTSNSRSEPQAGLTDQQRELLENVSERLVQLETKATSPERLVNQDDRRDELLANLSARISLVETASIALQRFESEPGIGSVCICLEHAVRMLADAHEQVEKYFQDLTDDDA